MTGTRFRTLKMNAPQRDNEIELSGPKFKIKNPVRSKRPKIWRSSKSAAMGYFWTKTERGKSWKRWTADKEAYGAKWGYYLMSGTNIPYLNPEKFIERNGYRVIELRMKRSAVRDEVESKLERRSSHTHVVGPNRMTSQKENTHLNTNERKPNERRSLIDQILSSATIAKGNLQQDTGSEMSERKVESNVPEEFFELQDFEGKDYTPTALSLKINPNTVDFMSHEVSKHIELQIVFGMWNQDEEELQMQTKPGEREHNRIVLANATQQTHQEEIQIEEMKTQETEIRRKDRKGTANKNNNRKCHTLAKSTRIKNIEERKREEAAKRTPKNKSRKTAPRKPQIRNRSADLLRGGVRVGVIKNQQLRLASAGVSLPPEKN